MPGGLLQLVAYGAQDVYLVGNPQISFFKQVNKTHTHFAMESIPQLFSGKPVLGSTLSCLLNRQGDLVSKMWLEITYDMNVASDSHSFGTPSDIELCDSMVYWVHRFGHALLKTVSLEIGGQIIDVHTGEWLELWSQMSRDEASLTTLRTLIGGSIRSTKNGYKMYVPLQFWFNRITGLALPLIALQYHDVKIKLELQKACHLNLPQGVSLREIELYSDFIFLGKEERRRFAQQAHEYLIEQVQETPDKCLAADDCNAKIPLPFNLPCKELVWVVQPLENGYTSGNAAKPFLFSHQVDFSESSVPGPTTARFYREFIDSISSARLCLSGQERFSSRHSTYFRCVQPYQHHTGGHLQGRVSSARGPLERYGTKCGEGWKPHNTDGSTTYFHNPPDGIHGVHGEDGFFYVYSFGLYPEQHQPSGTLNLSRIQNATLYCEVNTRKMIVKNSSQLNDTNLFLYEDHLPKWSSGIRWVQIGQSISSGSMGDRFGYSFAMNGDGTRIVVGAVRKNGVEQGYLQVYENTGSQWIQIGQDIEAPDLQNENVSAKISMNQAGTIIAFGYQSSHALGNIGCVNVLQLVENTWTQLGQTICGNPNDLLGYSVSLSNDGFRMAAGGPGDDTNGNEAGHVRVFEYDSVANTWTQMGANIYGTTANSRLGYTVALNSDGSIVVIGGSGSLVNSQTFVKVYQFSSGVWSLLGASLNVGTPNDGQRVSVSIDDNGSIIAIGVPFADHNSLTNSGMVQVYTFNTNLSAWEQSGSDIIGDANDKLGYSVSLSRDGSTLSISSPGGVGTSLDSMPGHAKVYQYQPNVSDWIQLGKNILWKDAPSALLGENKFWFMSMSPDGSTVAIGTEFESNFQGTLQVYKKVDTGTTNFPKRVKAYATNYNVLRIMSGMGGLAYAN